MSKQRVQPVGPYELHGNETGCITLNSDYDCSVFRKTHVKIYWFIKIVSFFIVLRGKTQALMQKRID